MAERDVKKWGFLLLVVAGLLLYWSIASKSNDPEAEGVWKVDWVQVNGMPQRRERQLWLIRGGTVHMIEDDGVRSVRLRLNPATTPKQIESSSVLQRLGIYEVVGEELHVAQAPSISQRPSEFKTEFGDFRTITFLRRISLPAGTTEAGLPALVAREFGPKPVAAPRRTFDPVAEEQIRERFLAINETPRPGSPDTPDHMIWNIDWMETEINNGGFHQYFFNSTGDHSADTARQLRLIGAVKTAELIERGRALFPGGKPAIDLDERRKQLEPFTLDQHEQLRALEEAFYARDEDLFVLLRTYLEKSP